MSTDFNFDALLSALAKAFAEKVRAELGNGNGAVLKPRLLSMAQAGAYIGRSKEAMRHMAASGKIPVVRADRCLFFDVKDLDRWIEGNKRPAGS